MINPGEYTIRLLEDMPSAVPGFVAMSPDGHFNIYINARLNRREQRRAIKGELEHVENDDFYNDDDIRTIEARAHGKIISERKRRLPRLMMASDLLAARSEPVREPVQTPVADEERAFPLTPHQARMVLDCLRELDRWSESGGEARWWVEQEGIV